MSRIKEYVAKKDAEMVADARRRREAAFRYGNIRAQDYGCADLTALQRLTEGIVAKREAAKFNIEQVNHLFRVRASKGDLEPLVQAHDALTSAVRQYDYLIKQARVARKLRERTCARPAGAPLRGTKKKKKRR